MGVEILLADKSPSIVTSAVIIPPCNKNLEPVIPPSAFNINPPLELDIWVEPISKPPIVPSVEVILPDMSTLPALSKWKLEELISMFWLLPLINCDCPPKKNLSPRMFILEPLKNTLSDLKTKFLLVLPSPPTVDCPNDIRLLSSALNKKPPLADIKAVNSELS